ncbi:thiamine pyrophosphate-dependent enzyme [Saccharopolyspora sp. K220]|uniref:thiamine pyrophosphate-dependent enzyme n=1 Tax=Saccharopolyspora soli TaxID=2926618 RepID=UPI001F5985D7|nr:thiamine pyrophosphate-dependent enzyme [Saccharopolyspora soli]MCI2418174.1 thiamine pyrophosphate-dependent enzyme [Saccharopolyspora soli]
MKRIEALRATVALTAEVPVVATCAATSRELAAVADRPNHFYLLDAMGLTTSVGTGLALACEGTAVSKVVTIDGDGSLLMNLGALATAGYLLPKPLVVLLLDNGTYASTADIPTQAQRLDLGRIAEACDLEVLRADSVDSLRASLAKALESDGPMLIHTRIEPGNTSGIPLLLEDPVVLGARFRQWLVPRLSAVD